MTDQCSIPESVIFAIMDQALSTARYTATHGDVPVGAVVFELSSPYSVVSTAGNLREQTQDPSAHAEIVALRSAAQKRRHWNLSGLGMLVTLEPCPMCMGALVNARIGGLWFGAWDPKGGSLSQKILDPLESRLNHRFSWTGGIRAPECGHLLTSFFSERRQKQ